MELITNTGQYHGSAELLFADGKDHYAFYVVRERRLLFGFIPFKKQVATKRFSFPQRSMSPQADGFREYARDVRLNHFAHLNFV